MSREEILALLAYEGFNSRQAQPIADGVILNDYRDTDANERNISTLLSSQDIPFHIERPKGPAQRREIRMAVTIPRDRQRQVEELLASAVRASALEIVEGTNDMLRR